MDHISLTYILNCNYIPFSLLTEYNVDCEYTNTWAPWASCSAGCGHGTRGRTKEITVPWSGHGVCLAPEESEPCYNDCTVLAVSIAIYGLVGFWAWVPLVFDASCGMWPPKRGRKSMTVRRCDQMMWSEQCCHAFFVIVAIVILPVGITLFLIVGMVGFMAQCYLGCCSPYDPRGWTEVILTRGVTIFFSFFTGWTCFNWERICSGSPDLYRSSMCPCCGSDNEQGTTCVECCCFIGKSFIAHCFYLCFIASMNDPY